VSDLNLGLLLENASCGNANVVIIGERGANQFMQLWFAKDFGPLLIGDGILGVGYDSSIVGTAESRRSGNGWAIIARAYIAAGDDESCGCDCR
jgi:hypothetical protein